MGRITEIDTFRAWAAMSVLLFHYVKEFYPGWKSFFLFGWSGVDLFFVISGFVMYLQVTRKYVTDERIYYKKYFRNRFLRIAPAFYVSLLAEVVLLHRDKLFSKEFFMHLSFTHVLNYDVAFSIQPIYWTLGIEVQFYIFLILMAGLVRRNRFLYLNFLMIASLLYRFIVAMIFGYSDTGILLINQLPGRLPQFICGIFLAMAYMNEDFWRSFRKWRPYLLTAGVLIFFLCGSYWLKGGDEIFNDVLTSTIFHPLLGFSFALIMAALLRLRGKLSVISRFRPLVFIGIISYSLYLWHFFFLEVTVYIAGLKDTMLPSIAMLITAGAAFSFATFSYYVVEKQFLKLKT